MLNTRELATLVWLVVAVTAALIFVPDVRRPAKDIGRLLLGWKLLVPIAVVVGWIVGLVIAAERLGAWTSHLVGDTVVTAFSLFVLVFSFDRAVKEPRFMRRVARDALGLAVLLEAFVNLRTFNLVIELLAQPLLFVLVATGAVAETQDEYRPVKRFVDGLLGVVGITVLMVVSWSLLTSWREISADDVRAFALPVWLVMLSLPVVYLVWLFAAYDSAFLHVGFVPDAEATPTWWVRFRSRFTLLVAFRASVRDAGSFPGYAARRLRSASSLKDAVAIARAVRQDRLDREAEEAAKAQRLVDLAGVDGEDDEGRRLDQREFAETRGTLRWLATCHMGWYDRRNRYRDDLLGVALDATTRERYGLPAEHGITMRVSDDGQRWYAMRRTVTGWWFAIGASGPPPSQWEYDGAEPPQGYPGLDPAWGNDPLAVCPNW